MMCCGSCTMTPLRGGFNLDWRFTNLQSAFALTRDVVSFLVLGSCVQWNVTPHSCVLTVARKVVLLIKCRVLPSPPPPPPQVNHTHSFSTFAHLTSFTSCVKSCWMATG